MQPFRLPLVPTALRLGYFAFKMAIELTRREPLAITGDGGVLEPKFDPYRRLPWRRAFIQDRHGQAQVPVPDCILGEAPRLPCDDPFKAISLKYPHHLAAKA